MSTPVALVPLTLQRECSMPVPCGTGLLPSLRSGSKGYVKRRSVRIRAKDLRRGIIGNRYGQLP